MQYYRYARGDGKADLWPGQHLLRYASYLGGLALFVVGLLSLWWLLALSGLLLLAGAIAFRSWKPCRRLARAWSGLTRSQKLRAVLWVPVIRVAGDAAKMVGYPVGLWWRWLHRAHRRHHPAALFAGNYRPYGAAGFAGLAELR